MMKFDRFGPWFSCAQIENFQAAVTRLPRESKSRMCVVEPFEVSPWLGRVGESSAEREVTVVVRHRVQTLTGQEHVSDVYGAVVKENRDAQRMHR